MLKDTIQVAMKNNYDENDVAVKEVKKKITRKRIEITEEKSTVEALGIETDAVAPADLAIMYAGKLCVMLVKMEVSSGNIISGYRRKYGEVLWNKWNDEQKIKFLEYYKILSAEKVSKKAFKDLEEKVKEKVSDLAIPEQVLAQLKQEKEDFLDKFKEAKVKLCRVIEKHPLWEKLSGIKGFTSYQLGLLMSYIKDIKRFEHFSQLSVYSGLASITDVETGRAYPITKATINVIKEIYAKKGKEFKGFNTELSGRMFVITECLLRSQGFFYRHYLQLRQRLEAQAIQNGKCEKIGEGEASKWMMKNKKNQSLIAWSNSNAKRRVATMLLYFVWEQWKMLMNEPIRELYVMEILAHKTKVTLVEVLKADSIKISRPRKDKSNEGEEGASAEPVVE